VQFADESASDPGAGSLIPPLPANNGRHASHGSVPAIAGTHRDSIDIYRGDTRYAGESCRRRADAYASLARKTPVRLIDDGR